MAFFNDNACLFTVVTLVMFCLAETELILLHNCHCFSFCYEENSGETNIDTHF